jgi:hypothetical protein
VEQDQSERRDSPDAEDASSSWEPTQPAPAEEREPAEVERTADEPTPSDESTPSDEPAPAPDQPATWSTPSDQQPSWAEPSQASDAPSQPDEPAAEAEPAAEPAATTWSERMPWPAEPAPAEEPPAEPAAAEPASTDAARWAAGEASEPAWPTEPPAAGSADADAWPTSAPEREEEPAWREPPPSEVEAYPAGPTPEEGAAAGMAAAHSVPAAESATGESTQCPRCGTENRPGLSFCRNCGQRLVAAGVASTVERPGAPEGTMACPRCGTHNRAGVAFCQNCGANLRGTAPGYVPPAVGAETAAAPAAATRGGAVLGPVVLLIGLAGVVTGYLLPFLYGSGSLFERAMGSGGYGISFWSAYPEVDASLADQVYFGLAAPVPLLGLLLLLLTVAGFVRAAPGAIQVVGLVIALLWSVGLIAGFGVVELARNWTGDLVGMLRVLTPAGIIFFLSSLIILIGTLTRFARS